MELIGKYQNGTYVVEIYDDGTKVRTAPDDRFLPDFAESIDMQISSKCNNACPMCYANCTPDGEFCDFSRYNNFLNSLHIHQEVAIDGNNLDHPGLFDFLTKMQHDKIIINMTVNQIDFEKNVDLLREWSNRKLIHGLGVSLHHASRDFVKQIKQFPNAVIHVINGMLTQDDIDRLKDNDLKILILGFKHIGKGEGFYDQNHQDILSKSNILNNQLTKLIDHFKVISFDNLALKQLDVRRLMTQEQWDEFYMGDDGTFTFFVNLVKGYFASDSLSPVHYPLEDKTIDECFQIIRSNK